MITNLKQNIEREIEGVKEISGYLKAANLGNPEEKELIDSVVRSAGSRVKMINNSIPGLVKNVSVAKPLPSEARNTGLEKVSVKTEAGDHDLVLHSKDREGYLRELNISEVLLKKIKRRKPKADKEFKKAGLRKSSGYTRMANKFFLEYANKLVAKGYFKDLFSQLRRANLDVLFKSYISIMLFTTFASAIVGAFLMVFLLFFTVSFSFPFVGVYQGSILTRLFQVIWVPIVLPAITFLLLYMYPRTEQGSVGKKIDSELPFAVVHMSAISGSGIEPTKIFEIIGKSREYKFVGKEIRKILNQINLYGYDLVTSLNNVAKSSPSKNLTELLSGLSATITSGGDLNQFFKKRAETLLLSYRLEREKFSKIAETFMDIYISVVIATPMILLLLLVIISVTGLQIGFSANTIAVLIVVAIAIINMVFIGVLHVKQPAY